MRRRADSCGSSAASPADGGLDRDETRFSAGQRVSPERRQRTSLLPEFRGERAMFSRELRQLTFREIDAIMGCNCFLTHFTVEIA